MLTADHSRWGFTASTGLGFSHHSIVDAHFEACRPAYEHLLRRVGIRPGWHVLDAGCGSGDFLPWLAELAGPGGRVSAVDLAAENVALAGARADTVHVTQADLRDLPYASASFDAVWSANTVQYLDDDELRTALAELRRVVRPGGTIAIKDLDAHSITVRPGDPYLFADFFRAAGAVPGYARQLLRSRDLYRHVKQAGLVSVRQETVLIEHFAPLTPQAHAFYGPSCARIAAQALDLGLAAEWTRFVDPGGPDNPLHHPDGYISEGNVLTVASVPPA
ncbi:class I SAM-dependent methyltransferase [Amycolatopsis sp. NPDC005961]|uniref:class I SAM-dependent methyltransferase n=1 Tax=Amycolatopsis sp. NPDC005961 TaxID=3156720 RepID=UPI0033C43DAF